MAVRADNGQPRSYLVNSILGVNATQTSFSPRYPIELTPSGPQTIPHTASSGSGGVFGLGRSPIRRSPVRRSVRSTSFGTASGPPEEVYERYRGMISLGTLRNWRMMKIGPSFLKLGRAVLYPLSELEAWDRKNLVICRAAKVLAAKEREAAG